MGHRPILPGITRYGLSSEQIVVHPTDPSSASDLADADPRRSILLRSPTWQTLGLMLLVSYGYVWHLPLANEQSRLNLVYAIVFHGTLRVDEYCDSTIDMAYYNGHHYCDKAPGLSFVAAPIMWALKPLYLRVVPTRPMRFFLTIYCPRFFALCLPCAVFGVLFYQFLCRTGASLRYRLMLVLGYALGTLALPYSSMFYGHQLGAALGFGAFMVLAAHRDKPAALWPCACAGLLAGYAVVVEYPMAAVAVILGFYVMFTRERVREWAAFAAAGLAAAACLLLYNYVCFDNPFALAYSFEKTEHFRSHHGEGFLGLTMPSLKHLYIATLSTHRGVFSLSPFLLLSPFGWWRMVRDRRWRVEAWVSLAVVVAILAYASTLWEESYACAPGHRHCIPMLPFAVLPLAFCPRRLRPWVVGLALVSIAEMTIINFVDPRSRETLTMSLPFLELFAPKFLSGQLDYNWGTPMGLGGLLSTVPFWITQAGLALLLFARRPGARSRG